MAFADNDGAQIFWEEQGEGSPILLVMGHSYSSAMWYPVLDELSKQHRLISFDNRGTGKSSKMKKITVDDMASDAFAVMDAAGVESAHLYGVSMGGGIILEMARQRPERVRSLLLGCTLAKTPDTPGVPFFLRPLLSLPAPIVFKLVTSMNRKESPFPYGTKAPADKVARDVAVIAANKGTVLTSVAQTRAIMNYSIPESDVRAMTMPALVMHGDEDTTVPYEAGVRLHELIKQSELLTIHGAAHNFYMAGGDEANAKVLDFLGRVDAEQSSASAASVSLGDND